MNDNINDFIKYMRYELNRSTHTVSAYKADLELFFCWTDTSIGADVSIKDIGTRDIRHWMVSLQHQGISPRSVRRKVQSVRAFFRWALKRSLIDVDVSRMVSLPKFEHRLPDWVRPEVIDQLLDELSSEQSSNPDDEAASYKSLLDRLIIQMLYETGIRREELITLRDADVDIVAMQLKVLGKRNKERIIPFGPSLAKAISEFRVQRINVASHPSTFFTLPSGEPLYPTYVYKIVRHVLEQVGQPGKSPHKLRHSFASAMLNNGAEINSVKERLGHASLAATQVYTHITVSELKDNYQLAHPRADKKRRKL